MLDTSTQHKMDPVKFVSRVQNLKLARETGSNTNNENYEREINKVTPEFSWWLSGKVSPYQCKRHGLDAWSWKIPHAVEQLRPCNTTIEFVI